MPTYLNAINEILTREAARHPGLVQFGENILQGSRICGVARNLTGRVLTVGNCENTHVGVGLGMMMEGGQALLVVKQLDFLLLALDQMVNTLGLIRASMPDGPPGSFTIITIVCDQGWQGPQSSFHDLAGICGLARADGFHLNGVTDAAHIIRHQLARPGFRILALSQRRFGEEALALPVTHFTGGEAEIQYSEGADLTIAALGFTLPEALEASAQARGDRGRAAIFGINPVLPHHWPMVTRSAARSRRLMVFDDGKGTLSLAHKLASSVLRVAPDCHVSLYLREEQLDYSVNADRYMVTQ